MSRLSPTYLTFFALALGTGLWPDNSEAQSVRFDHLTVADGLSGSQIRSIGQDGRGFVWIGTNNGLNRWDGAELRTFKHIPGDSTTLSHDFIHKVLGCPDGSVWIGTRDGLNRFDPVSETFESYRHDPADPGSLGARGILDVAVDADGYVWAAVNGGGLSRLNPETREFVHYRHDPKEAGSVPSDVLRTLYFDTSGRLWVGTIDGLALFDRDVGKFTTYVRDPDDPESIASNRILAIDEDDSGRLIIGTWAGGIDRLDPAVIESGADARFEHIRHESDLDLEPELRNIRALAIDGTGTLWAATWTRGLNRIAPADLYAGRRSDTYLYADPIDPYSIIDTDVLSIFEDREGILWFGTATGGLSRLDRRVSLFGHVHATVSVTGKAMLTNVTALVESSDGSIWIGTREGGLRRINRATGLTSTWNSDPLDPTGLPSNRITSLFEGSSGRMWVGTSDEGLALLDVSSGAFRQFKGNGNDATGPPSRGITSMMRSRDGRILMGSGSGAYWIDPGTMSFERIGGLDQPDRNVMDVLEDASGVVWIGHDIHGLKRLDAVTGQVERFQHDEHDERSLSSSFIRRLHEDARGRIWVATTRGLDVFVPESHDFERIDLSSGFQADEVRSIVEDDRGRLWLGTNRGLAVFDPDTRLFKNYDKSDGLQGIDFSTAAFRSESGHLWFGGSGGFNVFHPDTLRFESDPPTVVFTDLEVAGGRRIPVSAVEAVTMSYTDRAFTIRFAAMSQRNPRKNRFRYRLVGVNEEWTELGTENSLTLTGLSAGSYSLEVLGANSDGIWSETPAVLALTITPPWWNSRLARILYVLLIGVALLGVRRYEKNRTRLKYRLDLEAAERKKLAELDQVKSRFLANLSHEFRTPLTLIIGPLQNMVSRRKDAGEPTEEHTMMLRNARRLQRLINQILDLSRLESGHMDHRPEMLDLNAFVRNVVGTMAPLAERESVRLTGPNAEMLPVMFDAEHMEKVLGNLLSNALKFTGRGGRVDVELRARGSLVEIEVRDTGIGIPEDRLPHVFDRFVQVDSSSRRKHEGSGIGLSLARELMELHGGTIRAESIPGRGSTFTAVLPLTAGNGFTAPAQPYPEARPDHFVAATGRVKANGLTDLQPDRTRILVVDDNADVRRFVRSLLEREYVVFEASDGVEGLDRARAELPDLIVADVMMPRLDGFELSRALKDEPMLAGVPVILLTARAAVEDELEGLGTGADHFVRKPFEPDVLMARVKNLLDGRRRLKALYMGEPAKGAAEQSAFVAALFDVIDRNMTDSRFSVEMMADRLALSPSQLRRRTKDELGKSPNELIRERRLNRAAELLQERAGSVSEIGFAVGFNSLNYFSRSYSAYFGAPPSEHLTGTTRR